MCVITSSEMQIRRKTWNASSSFPSFSSSLQPGFPLRGWYYQTNQLIEILKTGRTHICSGDFWDIVFVKIFTDQKYQVLLKSPFSKCLWLKIQWQCIRFNIRWFSHLITMLTQVMAVGRISLAKLLISVLIVSKEGLGHTKFESSGGLELPGVGVGQSCKAPYQ